jgi:hypothetical protein
VSELIHPIFAVLLVIPFSGTGKYLCGLLPQLREHIIGRPLKTIKMWSTTQLQVFLLKPEPFLPNQTVLIFFKAVFFNFFRESVHASRVGGC